MTEPDSPSSRPKRKAASDEKKARRDSPSSNTSRRGRRATEVAASGRGDVSPLVPKAAVARLSLYLRELQHLQREGHATTSSRTLGQRLGFTDAQVRKDLANFGQFGIPGVGYRCEELIASMRTILGTHQHWPVALIGIGNLGRALLRYRGFDRQGFRIVAAFDSDATKVGRRIEDVPTYHIHQLREVVGRENIRLAIVAVPAVAAQSVADLLVAADVEGVLNFAPVTLSLPAEVSAIGVDLAIELEQLAYNVIRKPTREQTE